MHHWLQCLLFELLFDQLPAHKVLYAGLSINFCGFFLYQLSTEQLWAGTSTLLHCLVLVCHAMYYVLCESGSLLRGLLSASTHMHIVRATSLLEAILPYSRFGLCRSQHRTSERRDTTYVVHMHPFWVLMINRGTVGACVQKAVVVATSV